MLVNVDRTRCVSHRDDAVRIMTQSCAAFSSIDSPPCQCGQKKAMLANRMYSVIDHLEAAYPARVLSMCKAL